MGSKFYTILASWKEKPLRVRAASRLISSGGRCACALRASAPAGT